MSDLLRLRDHSQPCEHEEDPRWPGEAREELDGVWYCVVDGCPGGREIVLRRQDLIDPHETLRGPVYVVVTDDE